MLGSQWTWKSTGRRCFLLPPARVTTDEEKSRCREGLGGLAVRLPPMNTLILLCDFWVAPCGRWNVNSNRIYWLHFCQISLHVHAGTCEFPASFCFASSVVRICLFFSRRAWRMCSLNSSCESPRAPVILCSCTSEKSPGSGQLSFFFCFLLSF